MICKHGKMQKKQKNTKSLQFVANFFKVCYNLNGEKNDRKNRIFGKTEKMER